MDTLTGWNTIRLLLRLAVQGPEAHRSREGLELWYGPQARPPELPLGK